MDEQKHKKTEDLLVKLEELVDTWKGKLKQGKDVNSNQIIVAVDRLLLPFSRDVEFHELKGNWSPLTNVKWYRIESATVSWTPTFCNELYAITFDAPQLGTFRLQIRHRFSCDNSTLNFVTIEKDPSQYISWHRLTPSQLAWRCKDHLLPVLFAVISENCVFKESLNLHKLKNAIAACSFD